MGLAEPLPGWAWFERLASRRFGGVLWQLPDSAPYVVIDRRRVERTFRSRPFSRREPGERGPPPRLPILRREQAPRRTPRHRGRGRRGSSSKERDRPTVHAGRSAKPPSPIADWWVLGR